MKARDSYIQYIYFSFLFLELFVTTYVDGVGAAIANSKYEITLEENITMYHNNVVVLFVSIHAHRRVDRGNLVLRHSVPHVSTNSASIAC